MKKYLVKVYEIECTMPITFKCEADNESDIVTKFQLDCKDISTYVIKEIKHHE